MVALLVRRGSNVSYRNRVGWTALHIAAHDGSENITDLLIGARADINIVNNNNETPLQIAVQNGNINDTRFIDSGEDIGYYLSQAS